VNPGKIKALEAAKLTQGTAIFPVFAPGENTYPPELPPVTPEQYRKHAQVGNVLDDKQLEALAHMKGMNDFNDLANKSVLGREGVDRQVLSAVNSAIEKHQARIEQQTRIQRLDATPQEKQQRRSAKIG
jgi:putative DNA primase/helicase